MTLNNFFDTIVYKTNIGICNIMKLTFDIFTLIAFFAAYKFFDIYVATAVIIICYSLLIATLAITKKPIDKTTLISWILITVMGGMTLFFHNDAFIKFKPTIIYWLFAIAFQLSPYFKKRKTIMEHALEQHISLPKHAWTNLNIFWIIFFYILGSLNLGIAYYYDTDTWVNFKTFGTMGLMLIALIGQMIYLSKYLNTDKKNN